MSPPVIAPVIALAAGGTGGHMFPAEALARALVNTAQGLSTASKVDPAFAGDTIDQVRRLLR